MGVQISSEERRRVCGPVTKMLSGISNKRLSINIMINNYVQEGTALTTLFRIIPNCTNSTDSEFTKQSIFNRRYDLQHEDV